MMRGHNQKHSLSLEAVWTISTNKLCNEILKNIIFLQESHIIFSLAEWIKLQKYICAHWSQILRWILNSAQRLA